MIATLPVQNEPKTTPNARQTPIIAKLRIKASISALTGKSVSCFTFAYMLSARGNNVMIKAKMKTILIPLNHKSELLL